jgi:hypothetical protein
MSVFFYKRGNNKTGLIFSLVCIFYFLLLTVYQYIIPMKSGFFSEMQEAGCGAGGGKRIMVFTSQIQQLNKGIYD